MIRQGDLVINSNAYIKRQSMIHNFGRPRNNKRRVDNKVYLVLFIHDQIYNWRNKKHSIVYFVQHHGEEPQMFHEYEIRLLKKQSPEVLRDLLLVLPFPRQLRNILPEDVLAEPEKLITRRPPQASIAPFRYQRHRRLRDPIVTERPRRGLIAMEGYEMFDPGAGRMVGYRDYD
jgi:hypothetical protein